MDEDGERRLLLHKIQTCTVVLSSTTVGPFVGSKLHTTGGEKGQVLLSTKAIDSKAVLTLVIIPWEDDSGTAPSR